MHTALWMPAGACSALGHLSRVALQEHRMCLRNFQGLQPCSWHPQLHVGGVSRRDCICWWLSWCCPFRLYIRLPIFQTTIAHHTAQALDACGCIENVWRPTGLSEALSGSSQRSSKQGFWASKGMQNALTESRRARCHETVVPVQLWAK